MDTRPTETGVMVKISWIHPLVVGVQYHALVMIVSTVAPETLAPTMESSTKNMASLMPGLRLPFVDASVAHQHGGGKFGNRLCEALKLEDI